MGHAKMLELRAKPMNEITAAELKARLDAGDDLQLIDVR